MAKQAEIPGTEKQNIKEISEAADEYVKARDRLSALRSRKLSKFTAYSDDDFTIEVVKEKIKAKRNKPPWNKR